MRPTYHTSSIILILGILILISAGCGKKHLHVSTMSGSPGEEELAMDLDASNDQSGLESSGLDESGLDNQNVDGTAASLSDDLEPLDFTHETPQLNQASDSQPENDLFAGLDAGTSPHENQGEGLENAEQGIQSQSPSFEDGLGGSNSSDSNLGNPETDDLPPLVAFENSNDSMASGFGEQNGEGESALPIEEMPGNIAVAKADPSDTFGEQFDKIKEEEAAALAAGLTDVFFEFDSWNLTSEGRHALEQGAEWLHKKDEAKLLVEGHCDTRGTQAYNLVLGKKRAGVIRDYLVELGITPERVSIISYGQDKPFCSDPTEVCYQLNRRGHLLVQNP
ncbi:OmpA family protein [Nitrospira sp. M1]